MFSQDRDVSQVTAGLSDVALHSAGQGQHGLSQQLGSCAQKPLVLPSQAAQPHADLGQRQVQVQMPHYGGMPPPQ